MGRKKRAERAPGMSWFQYAFYGLCARTLFVLLCILHGLRVEGRENVPLEGGVIVAANHQSFFDSIIVGTPLLPRAATHVAREGLFKTRLFGWLISVLNALPLRQEEGDMGAIREVLRRLEAGEMVVLFPEGARTYDGQMMPFKSGIGVIIRRSGCPVLPVGFDGAFDIWPRTRKLPRIFGAGKLHACIGNPIPADELMKEGAKAGVARLQHEIDTLRMRARQGIRSRTNGRFPEPGSGDHPFDGKVQTTEARAD